MIEVKTTSQKFPGDIIEDIKAGRIHVVCMAQNGLTHLNVYAELYYKLPREMINKIVEIVNSKRETGTLYPQAYISILPKFGKTSEILHLLNPDELFNCLKDVFIANEEYLKSEIIYFTLEGSYVDTNLAFSMINEIVNIYQGKTTAVKSVWFEH